MSIFELFDSIEKDMEDMLKEFGDLIEEGKRVCGTQDSDIKQNASDNLSQKKIDEIVESFIRDE